MQSPFATATSSGGETAQEQGSEIASVPSTSDSGPADTSPGGDKAVAASPQPTRLVAINPQTVDRINLAAIVKTALGPRVRLGV